MFGSANKSRLQQQRMRQRTQLKHDDDDEDDEDVGDANNAPVVKATNRRAVAHGNSNTNNTNKPIKANIVKPTGISFAEPAANDDDDDDDDANVSAKPFKRLVAAVPIKSVYYTCFLCKFHSTSNCSSFAQESSSTTVTAPSYSSHDLDALRAQTRTIASVPRRSDEPTAIEVDELEDANEPVVGLPPPTTVRILSDEEIARAKQLKQESRNASAFVALDPRRQPDAPQGADLMAERIALTVASLQRTASLTDLDHDAEIARWELRNVHAGGGGAHAIGNALRQSAAGGKAPTTDHRRQATDIGAVDALIASECESKCFVRIVVGNNGSQMRAVRVRIQSQQPQIRAKDYYFVFILFIFQTFCFTHQLFLPSGRCFIGSSFG
jgi:hypothetical protein